MSKRATSTHSCRRKPQAKANQWKKAFLKVLRDTGNVRLACQKAKIQRSTAYKAKESNEGFAKEWTDAMDDACDLLEEEAWRRGVEGVEEPVFYQGEECGTIRRYSDGMLTLLLKGHRPEKYRERFEHTGPGGKPIPVQVREVIVELPPDPDASETQDPVESG